MNAVYSKDGNGRIVSMLTKASQSTQGLTKTYYYANFTELTKMTASEYGGTTRDYTYEHDMAGRLTRQVQNVFSPNSTTTYNYEWDALDRMTKVQRVASGVTKTINYTYNGAGLRVRRVDTSTSVTKLWTYQGNNIASVQESSGGSYGANDYVYTVDPGAINNVTERHKLNGTGSDSRYYQYDHRGNVVAVTDYSGRILRGYQYDAFGNIPFSFATGQSGAAPTDDILFTGKDLDPDTGLYYFNARWYDPEQGRFVTRSEKSPMGEHMYALCESNTINSVDLDGNSVFINAHGVQFEVLIMTVLDLCIRILGTDSIPGLSKETLECLKGMCMSKKDVTIKIGGLGLLLGDLLGKHPGGSNSRGCSTIHVRKEFVTWDPAGRFGKKDINPSLRHIIMHEMIHACCCRKEGPDSPAEKGGNWAEGWRGQVEEYLEHN